MALSTIAIFPEEAVYRRQHLFKALSELFSVDFAGRGDLDCKSCDGMLLFDVNRQQAIAAARSGLRSLAFINDGPAVSLKCEGMVSCASVPLPGHGLRGCQLSDKTLDQARSLKAEAGDEILARKGEAILWLRRKEGGAAVDLVAMEPPGLAENDYLFPHFQRDDWARLLPLLQFLREVSGWEPPPVRACFMFDDPNLHAKSYGYVNYGKLVKHAREHRYHVSFATVPLDGWYVQRGTAALFRENGDLLSLLIHGNNHTAKELARAQAEPGCVALAAQALRRIERFETTSGLKIPRVMAAPHGACVHDMATALLRTGFEAACISRGSIMNQNPHTEWPVSIGLNPAEFLGRGLPFIPRFRLKCGCETEMLLAAFLGQPIIPVGHHEDLAGGLGLLDQLADTLNATGEVQWTDMGSIARSNFYTRREGRTLHLKLFSRIISSAIPEGISEVCVHRPWLEDRASESLELHWGDGVCTSLPEYQGEAIPVGVGRGVEIRCIPPSVIDPHVVPLPRTPLWAIARRQLCEVRDRLRPISDRFLNKERRLES